jgi:hypothetical protein
MEAHEGKAHECKPLVASELNDADETHEYAHANAYLARSAPEDAHHSSSRRWVRSVVAGALGLVALAAVLPRHLNITVYMADGQASRVSLDTEPAAAAAAKPFDFTVKAGPYADTPGKGYPFIREDRFVEPHRSASFAVAGPVTSCAWAATTASGGGLYDDFVGVQKAATFSKSGTAAADTDSGDGSVAFAVVFPAPGSYQVSLTCDLADGTSATLIEEVSCMYVRRELRELTLVDREAFLDGFLALYHTHAEEGRVKYGKHFKPLSEFVQAHLDAGGARVTDHIHDGLGLLTQHTSLTMEFELALQAVCPRLAVPYWDYTVDSAKISNRDPDAMFTSISSIFHASELFKENFFGETDASANAVTAGRFASVQVGRDFSAATRSPRGYLRAPWNINPSKQVTRFHSILGSDIVDEYYTALTWPTCASHLGLSVDSKYATWFEWSWNAGYMPHGPVHAWVGGVGGGNAEATYQKLHDDKHVDAKVLAELKVLAFARLKNLWRDFAVETPKTCSDDAPVEECTWACTDDPVSNTAIAEQLAQAGVDSANTAYAEIVRVAVCEATYWPGDMFEAASPIEASFWPIHPTMDRLLQYKDLVEPFTDKTWLLDDDGLAHGGDACQYNASDCKGHHAGDLTYWKSVTKGDDGAYSASYLTNEEVRNALLPTGEYKASYIYNHFEWKHCDELGHVFPKV